MRIRFHPLLRSGLRALALAGLVVIAPHAGAQTGAPRATTAPHRIYAITFRGMTDVEKGFQEYFTAKRIPVQITFRDLARDASRMPGFLDEIRATKPDLIYTWGTSVTLGVVGRHGAVDPAKHITNIPVVFTLVAAPVQAEIVPDLASSGRNVTGVYHVAPTGTQIQAMASYRPFQTVGVIYTPTEQNSVVVVDELRRLGRERGFNVVERTFRVDGSKRPLAEGAADLVRELHQSKAEWLYMPPDSFLGTQAQDVIIPAAMAVRMPAFGSTEQLMEAGAVAGLVSRYHSIGQFTAYKAEQILVERKAPAAIPVETLKRFSLQVRMGTARQLELPPPLPMFNYAEVIDVPSRRD